MSLSLAAAIPRAFGWRLRRGPVAARVLTGWWGRRNRAAGEQAWAHPSHLPLGHPRQSG